MSDWYRPGVPSCVNCKNLKYLYDNSTTICLSCQKYNDNNIWMRNNWEPVPGSPMDILQRK